MIRINSQITAIRQKDKTKVTVLLSGFLATVLSLTACDKKPIHSTDDTTKQSSDNNSIESTEHADSPLSEPKTPSETLETLDDLSNHDMASTRGTEINIDWNKVDSGIKPVDESDFKYPFKLDSNSVKSQADFSNITDKQAQHSLTIGMASNEPLERILNQLGDSYLSHEYSASEAKLFVYTTPNVKPSHFDYVIEHEFAHGLILPIEVLPLAEGQNDSKKQ